MAQAAPGVAIAIEFGQLNAGLSAIMGMGRGLTEQKGLNRTIGSMAESSAVQFRKLADGAGVEGEIAHVYEYGQEGTLGGRLWSLHFIQRAGDTVGNIVFRNSEVPSPPDPRLEAATGANMASHLFPDKANHLETRETLTSVAGVNRYTTRVGGSGVTPRSLVYVDGGGRVRFAKRVTRQNEFYRKFQAFFTTYWVGQMSSQAEPKIARAFAASTKFGATEVNKAARSASMLPRVPRGMSGVFAMDRGKPYTGIKVNGPASKRVEKAVQARMEKELVRQWQR